MPDPTSVAAVLTLAGQGGPDLIATVELTSHLDRVLDDWDLQFDLARPVAAGSATRLLHQTGSHIGLKPIGKSPLVPGKPVRLCFTTAASSLQRLTDLPAGFYLRSGGDIYPVSLEAHNLQTYLADTAGRGAGPVDEPTVSIATDTLSPSPCTIIPRPQEICIHGGRLRITTCGLSVEGSTEATLSAEAWLAERLAPACIVDDATATTVQLRFTHRDTLGPEGYELRITAGGIDVLASRPQGFFYAAVSLAQLVEIDTGTVSLPQLSIKDHPRFAYRGFMLDCARHFHDKATIIALLDHMARLKLNHFHWHLTDDEGWRFPVAGLPALTARGAWRGEHEALAPQFGSGPERYGGYYSREDIREIVAFATRRHITVIPEIDIPGHSRAAIRALPDLLHEPADRSDYTSVQLYKDNVLNPALPGTYRFLEQVLDEVCALFPGRYVHIGGDEVPDGVWEDSPACQAMRAEHGYDSVKDLQRYLLGHASQYLEARDRQLAGWEEAAHGGKLPPGTTIYAWSSEQSAGALATAGYRVINCPAPSAYLDLAWNERIEEPGYYWAGTADLADCYACEPVADGLDPEARDRIIGVQAQLWTELVADRSRLEYMLFPRILAWSENAWTEPANKHWPDFLLRTRRELVALADLGVNHHPV